MIHINTGPAGSDCTAPYYISFDKPKTVGEFIEELLTTRPKEWGHFGIYKKGSFRGELSCDYKYGEIVGDPLPDEYLNAEIEKVTGYGGWTLSEFTFYLREDKKEDKKKYKLKLSAEIIADERTTALDRVDKGDIEIAIMDALKASDCCIEELAIVDEGILNHVI